MTNEHKSGYDTEVRRMIHNSLVSSQRPFDILMVANCLSHWRFNCTAFYFQVPCELPENIREGQERPQDFG